MAAKLSPTMKDALAEGLAHGGVLERWRGGWWTYPGCPVKKRTADGYDVPEWSCGVDTLRALGLRGHATFDPEPGGRLVKTARLLREPIERAPQ